MSRGLATIVAGLFFVVSATVVSAEEIDRHFEKSFEVEQGARLVLTHGDGDVVISPSSGDTIDVEVRYRASSSRTTSTDFEVEFEQTGNAVRVTGREPGFRSRGFSSYRVREYVYEIAAPAWVTLELDGSDGDVRISGWRASLDLENSDGDVDLRDFEAPYARLRTSDGDIEIDGLAAELEIKTSDGDMDLADCRIAGGSLRTADGDITMRGCSGSFDVRTSDGNFRAERLAAGRIRAESGDGDMTLGLTGGEDLDLEVRTGDGSVEIDHDATLSASFEIETRDGGIRIDAPAAVTVNRGRHRASGSVGEGEGWIRVTTGDGHVTLRAGD